MPVKPDYFRLRKEEAKALLGRDPRSECLVIPYRDLANPEKIRGYRFRLDEPMIGKDGKAIRYLTPAGASNLLYFPPKTIERLKSSESVIYTESALKALALAQRGRLAVGLNGVYGFNTRSAIDGTSELLPDFDLLDTKKNTAIIIFDSDVATNRHVKAARHQFAKALYKRGAPQVWSVDLPTADDGSKLGVDDYLARHSIDDLLGLEFSQLPATDLPPFTMTVSEMLTKSPTSIDWGIVGITPSGANGFRIGPPKVGKSWLTHEEIYSLSTGLPLYGHFDVPQKRRVLMIQEEDSHRRTAWRFQRLIHARGPVPEDQYLRFAVKAGFRLDDPRWREVLEFEIRQFAPEFIYYDVFNRLHTLNINDAQEMGELCLYLDYLTRQYGVSNFINHHDRKANGNNAGDAHAEIMGSRALGGFSEATMFFAKEKEKGHLKVEVALKDEPEKGFEPSFRLAITDTDDGHGTYLRYLGPTEEQVGNEELRVKIVDFVVGQVQPVLVSVVAKKFGVSVPYSRENLGYLADKGLLSKIEGKTKTSPVLYWKT